MIDISQQDYFCDVWVFHYPKSRGEHWPERNTDSMGFLGFQRTWGAKRVSETKHEQRQVGASYSELFGTCWSHLGTSKRRGWKLNKILWQTSNPPHMFCTWNAKRTPPTFNFIKALVWYRTLLPWFQARVWTLIPQDCGTISYRNSAPTGDPHDGSLRSPCAVAESPSAWQRPAKVTAFANAMAAPRQPLVRIRQGRSQAVSWNMRSWVPQEPLVI